MLIVSVRDRCRHPRCRHGGSGLRWGLVFRTVPACPLVIRVRIRWWLGHQWNRAEHGGGSGLYVGIMDGLFHLPRDVDYVAVAFC